VKESVKAVLWSIFIFPGSGHFYLKTPAAGIVIAAIAIAALLVVLSKMVERANQIAEKIVTGEVSFDLLAITEMVSKQSGFGDTRLLNVAWYCLIAIWIIGAIDAYRLGRIRETERAK